jgi:hypothetical protein
MANGNKYGVLLKGLSEAKSLALMSEPVMVSLHSYLYFFFVLDDIQFLYFV